MPNSLSLEEKLECTARSGFDFMELSIDETEEKLDRLDFSESGRRSLVESMYRTRIGIDTLCLSAHRKFPIGSADEALRRRGMDILAKSIDFAAGTGIRIIQLAGYDVYYEKSTGTTRAHFIENLETGCALAARNGVMLAFETMETEFMNTVKKAMRYVRKIDSPWLQVYPDLGNITNAAVSHGRDVLADLQTGEGHIAAVHLKESLPGKFRGIPYGAGHVDFDACIRTARDMGVGIFLAEFWHADDTEWLEQIRRAHDFFRPKLC
jgi:L-ribulose-5-phosphate 3-epimerase